MKVRKAEDCPFRHEDHEGDGTCWLGHADCPARRCVRREKPLPPQERSPISDILDVLTFLGPEPVYSEEDNRTIATWEQENAAFFLAHETVDAIPESCRLRKKTLVHSEEPVELEWEDPEYFDPPEFPDVIPLNQAEIEKANKSSMAGLQALLDMNWDPEVLCHALPLWESDKEEPDGNTTPDNADT